jgi:steroid 5-alpha reductase family enzyme
LGELPRKALILHSLVNNCIQTNGLAEQLRMKAFSMVVYLQGLAIMLAAAFCTWLLSVYRRNVAIVDSLWSLMILLGAYTYALGVGALGQRAVLILGLATAWALRLSTHITWRNWGHGEDRRYRAIRARNEPHFAVKSLYLVFGLQALLAWIISLPLLGAMLNPRSLGVFDALGTALWLMGFGFESVADWQLARFKSDPASQGQVMDRGLWRYARHPNYFGDFCVWWGLYLIAMAAGAWWSIAGPLAMSVLLMRVSGVTLLERDIGERRPQYADYVRRTNAFFPWPPD